MKQSQIQSVNPVKTAGKNAKKESSEPILVETWQYSEKSFAVFGNTKPIKGMLFSLKGRFNRYLKHPETGEQTPGYIFSISRLNDVERELSAAGYLK